MLEAKFKRKIQDLINKINQKGNPLLPKAPLPDTATNELRFLNQLALVCAARMVGVNNPFFVNECQRLQIKPKNGRVFVAWADRRLGRFNPLHIYTILLAKHLVASMMTIGDQVEKAIAEQKNDPIKQAQLVLELLGAQIIQPVANIPEPVPPIPQVSGYHILPAVALAIPVQNNQVDEQELEQICAKEEVDAKEIKALAQWLTDHIGIIKYGQSSLEPTDEEAAQPNDTDSAEHAALPAQEPEHSPN